MIAMSPTKSNNPAGLSHEEILALKGVQASPAPVQVEEYIPREPAKAPDITKRVEKVVQPNCKGIETVKVAGPSQSSLIDGERRRAAEYLQEQNRLDEEKRNREAMDPKNILARLAYLEREVKRLAKEAKGNA